MPGPRIDSPLTEPLVVGSIVDPGGVPRAKMMPASRIDAFAEVGAGASPSWNVFCADDQLAFTDRFSVTGDLRLRIDRSGLRDLGDGLSWAPAVEGTQDGGIAPSCTRAALTRTTERLAAAGLAAMVGHELEFVLFAADAQATSEWSAYGLGAAVQRAGFLQAVLARARTASLEVLQLHAEAAPDQFELSLAARPPVEAADDLMLARTIVSLAARDSGMAASFSPLPVIGGGGNGAHQHVSLTIDASPLFSGGVAPRGLTDAGAHAIAGILAALPDLGAVLAGSVLSHARLRPGMWSGAYACWGLENREAAVRLIAATRGNPGGAHIEVKPIDPSANPYAATALLLEAALQGIENALPLPREVTVDPRLLPEPQRPALLPTDIGAQLDRLGSSPVASEALGADIVEAVTAVRRLEHDTWARRPLDERAERFRFTWTC